MSANILVVEDDSDINDLVSMNLTDMHHTVDSCLNGRIGLEHALQNKYDLIVLDIMLPEVDGLEICSQLRAKGQLTPILMLTARTSEMDRVVGLELGADDYLTKPFGVRELQARVKAMLRRVDMLTQHAEEVDQLRFDQLLIDIQKREVRLDDKKIDLTNTEFDLLLYMARSPGHAFSRNHLLNDVWGYQHSGYEHTVNSHINRLRHKLEAYPSDPKFVLTVWGVGYKFNDSYAS